MYLKTVAGSYTPSYFHIYLNSHEPIDEAIKNNTATFIHEYIHFLQDLILPYCIRQNLIELNRFFLIIDEIHENGEIHRPHTIKDEDLKLTDEQANYTWGSGHPITTTSGIKSISGSYFTCQGAEGFFNVHKHTLTTNEGISYQIGARDFLEYIAHKIDRRVSTTDSPDFPYKTIDHLFNYLKLSHIDTQTRLCITEYCLHNDNPTTRLLSVIEEINEANPKILDSYDDCRNFLLTHSWKAKGVKFETIEAKISRRLHELQNGLQARFSQRNYSDVFQWIDEAICYVTENLANRLYFSELYGLKDEEFFDEIGRTINSIGVPLVFNNRNEVSSVLPKKYENNHQFLHFFLADQFIEFTKTTDLKCPLIEYCETNNHSLLDEKCRTTPHLRGRYAELCPFGLFSKAHGLDTIAWNINK